MNVPIDSMRLDKWLWCARFYKTRSIAVEEIGKGRVTVNSQNAKAARELRVGNTVALRQGVIERTVVVQGLSGMRGPAPVAQQLYLETEASQQARAEAAERRRLAPEPASALTEGRPTKRDRREIDKARTGWGDRWSASIDE
ncbi:RNA-binding S4 domain-containing protein [Diaphorobacter aerolatus]|uniref:RNA-binding S4 domain-containing protein n=1 Tax=Diaphorobacter aerolatus TaxID=1288495 RepID=A0A7H0GJN7_9BURK|nr:S4 domain-containing protein [Diaphorobacter aerolatus]QNP48503.1 RNA-binding S4 domain-containing protein [Diaphorobacter aerolatus]